MPRRGPAPRRELMPDPVYRSVLVTQIVNKILQRGKKTTAEAIVYEALDLLGKRTDGDALSALKRAVDNVKPQLEVKSRRVGGATYQVPVEVRPRRANTPGHPWLGRLRPNRRRPHKAGGLAGEPVDANHGIGKAGKRKGDMEQMGGVKKGFGHYRW